MATSIQMKNELNGLTKEGFYGYSWTTLFFGPFVPLFRGDFITFLGYVTIVFLISLMTAGIGGLLCFIIWSFFYNSFYTKKLLERGYKFNGTIEENKLASSALGVAVSQVTTEKNTKTETAASHTKIKIIDAPANDLIDMTQFFESETDISNEKYKLYLVTKFDIKKNDVLEKFIVKGEIFSTLDEALLYSKNIDDKDFETATLSNEETIEKNNNSPDNIKITGTFGPGGMYNFSEYKSGLVKVSHSSGFNKEFPSMAEAKKYFV